MQVGRAIAALMVVFHHAENSSHTFGGAEIPLLHHFYLGVDFFFVLSGFIILYSIPGKRPGQYVWHRFRRVYLPYLPIGIGIALAYTLMPDFSASDRGWDWYASITLVPFGHTALSVAWTLQHEILFYLIFGIAWFSGQRWIVWAWGAVCLLNYYFDIYGKAIDPINLEFLFGMLACIAVRRGWTSPWMLAGSVGFIGLWIALGAVRDLSPILGLGIALAIPPVVAFEAKGLRVPRVVLFFGAASYAIYLVHNPIIKFAVRATNELFLLAVIGTLAGIAYYLLFERPMLKLSSREIPIGSSFRRLRGRADPGE